MFSIFPIQIHQVSGNTVSRKDDLLAVEAPLEIRLGFGKITNRQQKSIAVTMRTPGHDFELALGFLYSEGIIQEASQVHSIKYCTDLGRQESSENIVRVELKSEIEVNLSGLERNFYATSSCGICGKASIESIEKLGCPNIPIQNNLINHAVIFRLSKVLQEQQRVFQYTGGLHAAGLFDKNGDILLLREDVGRHNALDKLIGASRNSHNLALSDKIILVSGRLSFELVQKTIMAGVPVLVAIGAPSSLAVELAQQFGLTLIGFLKNEYFNVYSGIERIQVSPL
ncbi:FdhD protein [Arcicella aurantiaca]|uniref:Sulfur carrier protein FdhD n=1 Tax=Arcicella aurantiaca TaxID=591202 RepID=A0A316EBY2_9BACT|nr:formate dehydrogenase accessory sulfurtransferase FdhD [Arcicella aurantiaca]PWK27088.1 FdhD protein [Arcicella aurantiaca]